MAKLVPARDNTLTIKPSVSGVQSWANLFLGALHENPSRSCLRYFHLLLAFSSANRFSRRERPEPKLGDRSAASPARPDSQQDDFSLRQGRGGRWQRAHRLGLHPDHLQKPEAHRNPYRFARLL